MMRQLFASIFCCIAVGNFASDVESAENLPESKEERLVRNWQTQLDDTGGASVEDRIETLSQGLRSLELQRSIPGHGTALDTTYFKLQESLLGIPGHELILAEKLERERHSRTKRKGRTGWRV